MTCRQLSQFLSPDLSKKGLILQTDFHLLSTTHTYLINKIRPKIYGYGEKAGKVLTSYAKKLQKKNVSLK